MTAAEATAIAGLPMNDGKLTPTSDGSNCEWGSTDETKGVSLEVDLMAFDPDLWAEEKSANNNETVSGLGEDAFRWQVGMLGPAGELLIKKGNVEIDVLVIMFYGNKQQIADTQIAVANLAVPRV